MRPRFLGIAALAALLALPAVARDVERASRLHRQESALPPPPGLLLLGVETTLSSTDWSPDETYQFTDRRETALTAAWGWRPEVRLSARLPWLGLSGLDELGLEPASRSGPGDVEVGLLLTPWRPSSWLGAALDLRATLPTGDEAAGLGDGAARRYAGLAFTARAWTDGPAPEMRVHLRAGRWTLPADAGRGGVRGDVLEDWPLLYPAVPAGGDAGDNDPLVLGAALEFRRGDARLFLEWTRHLYDEAVAAPREQPEFLTGGLRWGGETGPAVTLAYDVPLQLDDPSTAFRPAMPDMLLSAGVSWSFSVSAGDRDRDGIPDRLDPCPDAPEDVDGFRDDDGCPDPDNDEDGIPDAYDLAPDAPEDHDGYLDDDGLPDPDNDGDGIPDVRDACPDTPEDFDGHEDDDGCPEETPDRDGDGIIDADDACPDEPEDFDGYRDEDGCPDLDNDLDGIPDALDACPNEAEDYDGVDDDDGCPDPPSAPATEPSPGPSQTPVPAQTPAKKPSRPSS